MNRFLQFLSFVVLLLTYTSCQPEPISSSSSNIQELINERFQGNINLDHLDNYENQSIPNYIDKDNTRQNEITDEGATLGRILFYDKNLSSDRSISCASCHHQENSFGDSKALSDGVNGVTGRHSMRLINARFAREQRFFWDERARTLEEQSTMPIKDHIEMGFSGENGDLSFDDLIVRLSEDAIYPSLFEFVYGSPTPTEERIQNALAQFIRSIQSFDTRYDQGLNQVNNPNQPFPNFTQAENRGKQLFMMNANLNQNASRVSGGLGCQRCHNAPEFDITPNSRNNGVIHLATGAGSDFTITRSPSLRNIFNVDGALTSPMMHTGDFNTMEMVIDHYNEIDRGNNPNLDNRLMRNGIGQKLNITTQEKNDLIAFLKTLSGQDVFVNSKWSNPFE